jgi:hypothetical protein
MIGKYFDALTSSSFKIGQDGRHLFCPWGALGTCSATGASRPSVPNPKFAILCSALRANFGFDKDTSKLMILVSFMDQKFARWTRGNDGANF